MAVKLIIERLGQCGSGYYYEKVNVRTARGLLKKARKLAHEYSNYFLFSWHRAKVYLFERELKNRIDKGEDEEKWEFDIEYIFERGGYDELAFLVSKFQGVSIL